MIGQVTVAFYKSRQIDLFLYIKNIKGIIIFLKKFSSKSQACSTENNFSEISRKNDVEKGILEGCNLLGWIFDFLFLNF